MDDSASSGGKVTIDSETLSALIRACAQAIALASAAELGTPPPPKPRGLRGKRANLRAVKP